MTTLTIQTDLQAAYDEQYTPAMTAWRELGGRYKVQHFLDLCAGRLTPDSVLEVGAGEGSILKFLSEARFGKTLHAVEISHSGIAAIEARRIPRLVSVQHFDGYTLPFADQSIDLIVLSHVLEHVEFPRLLLRELRRVGRHVAIEVPCDFSFEVDRHVDLLLSYGHINVYTAATLRFLLRTEGFTILADRLDLTTDDVTEYNLFVNQRVPRTFSKRVRVRLRAMAHRARFALAGSHGKQLLAHSCTVLCSSGAHGLKVF